VEFNPHHTSPLSKPTKSAFPPKYQSSSSTNSRLLLKESLQTNHLSKGHLKDDFIEQEEAKCEVVDEAP